MLYPTPGGAEMTYHVAVEPDLALDTEAFADAWNASDVCRELAEAQVIHQPPQGFPLDPQMVQQGILVLAGAAGALTAEALKDAVKEKLTEFFKEKLSKPPEIEVDFVPQRGGGLLIVTQETP
jgi:hypothetical protein